MGTKIEAPEPRNYGQETRDNLQAQIDLAPDLFAAESNQEYGRPAQARLDFSIFEELLPELVNQYETQTAPGLARGEANARRISQEADIASIEDLGQQATEAALAANPRQRALIEALNDQALDEINAGASLDPSLRRETQQAVREAQADRGFGYGIGDIASEALFTGQVADDLRRRRQQFATNVVGVNAATTADPFMSILGRSGVNPAAGIGLQGQAQSYNPGQVFDVHSPYANSIYAGNQNATQNARIARANANSGIIGGALGAVGNIGGAIFS